jgi:hypothetical protein
MTESQKRARSNYKRSEKGKEANRRYHLSDAGQAANKRYQASTKGKAALRKWKQSDKGVQCRLKYQQSIRGRINSLLSGARCRAKRFGLLFDITADDLMNRLEATNFCCEATGMRLDFSVRGNRKKNRKGPSLDQKTPGAGYTKDNVQIVCVWFNEMKGDISTFEAVEILNEWRSMLGR